MKKLLPLLKNLLTKDIRSFFAALLVLAFICISGSAQAQVYYLTSDELVGTNATADALNRMNYDGSSNTVMVPSFSNSPVAIAQDLANNRLFIYDAVSATKSIKIVTASTGAITGSIPVPYTLNSMRYDAATDYIYFITTNSAISTDVSDALYKVKSTDSTPTLIKSSITPSPLYLALDIPNNRIFIYESTGGSSRGIKTYSLTSNTFTQTATINSGTVKDIAYDPLTDYLYYLTSDDIATSTAATDALNKVQPGGSTTTVIKAAVTASPSQSMIVDAGNNRAYIYEGVTANRAIKAVNLTTGDVSTVISLSSLTAGVTVKSMAVPLIPVLSTTSSVITSVSATLGGNITKSDINVSERGVVYSSTNTTPVIGNGTKAANGTGTGIFSQIVSGLSSSTTYYARAYATSGAGTAYGAVISFSTPSNDANLSAFTISAGTLTPSFSAGTVSYTASVANANSTITVTPTKNNANASIKVNTVAVNSGSASGAISLNVGSNTITTIVTAQDGITTKTYTTTVTRNKAAQTITFNALPTKTFGNLDFAPGASASSGLTVSYSSDNTNVATIVGGQIHIKDAGTANITASQAGDGNTLAATNVVQTLTVNKASQTITFNALPAKVYGNADFAPGATSSAGLTVSYASDNTAVATIVNNQIHIVGQGSANITASQAGDANRSAASNVAQYFTVDRATVTVAAEAKTKNYGDDDPAFTYIATGVVGSDAATGALTRLAGTNIGSYAINQGTLSYGGNYNLAYTGANLTINKRPITILPSAKTKVYGEADPYLNAFALKAGSFAPGDASSDQYGRVTGESVGTYLMIFGTKKFINGSTDVTANYDVTMQPAYVTITAKPIVVTANAQTKTYGDADPAFTYDHDALAFSDSFTGSLTRTPGEGFGTYAIGQGTLALSSNYTLNFTGANLTIDKKTINVTANALTKTYGTADPAFTYSNDALSFGDTFTGSLTRDAGEGAGIHAITQGSLALSNNYTLNYTGANLSIGKATLSYVAIPASRPFQTANPTFMGDVTGFVNGDNLASATSGTLSFTSTTSLSSPLGTYPIVGSGLSAANYDFVQSAANSTALTITTSIDATLAGLTVDQGTLNPVFSSSQQGYGLSVDNNVASFNLTATVNQQNASIMVNGTALTSGSSKNITLNTGTNNINVIVTAQDGVTTNQYSLNVFRAYDTNNLLAGFNLSGLTYSPTFDANTLNYTATVGNLIASTNVTATAVSPTTHIFVGGYDLATTNPVNVALNVGETEVGIVSKAENGDEKIYRVVVTRAPSSDATLSSLGSSLLTLNTPFVAGTHSYIATVPTNVSSLYFMPVPSNNRAVVTVNGQPLNVFSGNYMPIGFSDNTLTIDVTSEDGTGHIIYTVAITRVKSADATLVVLNTSSETTINEPFNPNTYAYTATVTDSTYTGLPLTATSADENAVVKINGTVVPRFQNYIMAIHGGENTFNIVVTSQDGSDTKTYTLVLTRAGQAPPLLSPVANLFALNVSSGSTFSNNFNFTIGEELRTIYAPNNIASVRVFTVSENAVSTVTVNGVNLPYDTSTDLLPISVGDNLFTVAVTSQDGLHSKTYDVHVTRLPFADVTLASLVLNKGTLTPNFTSATTSYTASVKNSVSNINVTPVATAAGVTTTVNNIAVDAAHPTATINLLGGPPTRIRTVVTAADGVNTKTYTVNVTRLAPQPTLATLTLSAGTLSPAFDEDVFAYTTAVTNVTTGLTLTPVTTDATATLTINGVPVASGAASGIIPLNIGVNTITTLVTSQDGLTTKEYVLRVTRLGSNNAWLSNIVLNPNASITQLTGAADLNYITSVNNATASITVTPTTAEANATIKVNGVSVISGTASAAIPLSTASTVIAMEVTAQDGVTKHSYSITVNKTGSSNAWLSNMVLNPNASITQVSGTADLNYITSVNNATASITVTPTAAEAHATIKVNGISVLSGTASAAIPLSTASTVIAMEVTAQDGVTKRSYSITVTKTGSSNAWLSNIVLNPNASITQVSGTADLNYVTSVNSATASITVTPTTTEAHATIKVNGVSVISGTASAAIPLSTASTVISMEVTAQDGVTKRSYSITVNKTGSSNAWLSNIVLDPNASIIQVPGPADLNYVTSLSNTATSITVKPTTMDANATVKVNGVAVVSGTASASIPLVTNSTVITMLVTAQDGVTKHSYSITVNKTGVGATSIISNIQKLNPESFNIPSEAQAIVVHQGLSPNGDGINDFLNIDGIGQYQDNQVMVMNRSGEVIYTAKGYNNSSVVFDGHASNGKLQLPGTYFYSLDYKQGNEAKRKTGYIVIKY